MKKITIVVQILVKGRLFRVNEQYCFTEIISQMIGCGCGGKAKQEKKFYRVFLNNVYYDIQEEFAIPVPPEAEAICPDPNFEQRRTDLGDTQQTKDFNPFRNNRDPKVIFCSANQGDATANIPR